MAWNYQDKESDGNVSLFNEAFLKMSRIHKLQDTINQCSINPLLFNPQYSLYNYEIIISCCNSLLSETISKAPNEYKNKGLELRKAIEKALSNYPIHQKGYNIRGELEIKFNNNNWIVINEWIFKYNLLIREIIGVCGYDSPNKEIDDGL